MFVGGREVSMQGGTGRFGGGSQTQIVEQAPVHYLIPPEGRGGRKLPVIMVPGMGLTSYLYLATPDKRDGWAQLFARAAHPVYVFDEPNNAISGFDVSAFGVCAAGVGAAGAGAAGAGAIGAGAFGAGAIGAGAIGAGAIGAGAIGEAAARGAACCVRRTLAAGRRSRIGVAAVAVIVSLLSGPGAGGRPELRH